jgi:hypothetical protein
MRYCGDEKGRRAEAYTEYVGKVVESVKNLQGMRPSLLKNGGRIMVG